MKKIHNPPTFCADRIGVKTNFAVITNAVIKRVHCTSLLSFTVPCSIVSADPEDIETWPTYLYLCFKITVRSSSSSPMAPWIFLRTSSLVIWSLFEIFYSLL